MKNKFYNSKEIIAEKLDFPREIVLNIPKITIISNNEINIENHKGIISFKEEEIKIDSNIGVISITGSNFEILFLGGSTITISGSFRAVLYEAYEGNK